MSCSIFSDHMLNITSTELQMEQRKHGLSINDETGMLILEVGPHVIREFPQFAAGIGAIAASWAQAEVNLYCLFAVLLNTTPEEAAKQIKKYGNAAKVTAGARKVAADTLGGVELTSVTEALDQLDNVRARRNRIQHDVWAKKGTDDVRLFAVHSNEYLAFATELTASNELQTVNPTHAGRMINSALKFAEKISNGYTLEDLRNIDLEINIASKSLLQLMFSRIILRLADE